MRMPTLASILMLLISTGPLAAPRIGEPAPAFVAVDTAGDTHRLEDYAGQVVVLEWTNHDCPYVRKHYDAGNMQAQQRAATAGGAVWLSVISSAPGKQGHVDAAEADALTASRNASPSAVLLDPEGIMGRAYGARTTPHMYIVDTDGNLVYQGGIDSIPSADAADIADARQYVRVALDEIRAGGAVTDAVTRPYGCSIKY
jgi:peroxiredoxin